MKKRFIEYGLAILSALLLSLSHPSSLPIISTRDNWILNTGYQEILAWFGMVPLLFAVYRRERWALVFPLAVFGILYFYVSCYWINIAIMVFGNIHYTISFATMMLLAVVMGLQWAMAVFWGIVAHRRLKLPLSLTLPVCYVAWELIRNYLVTGFTWQNMAYSQALNLPILQTASLWGIFGIGFLLILSNAVLFELLQWRLGRQDFPRGGFVALVALTAFSFVFGIVSIHLNDAREAVAPKIKAAMIQGNIDQETKNFSRKYAGSILKIYKGLSAQAPEGTQMVIWPEASYPYAAPRDAETFRPVLEDVWPEKLPWHMLIGSVTYLKKGKNYEYYNSGYWVGSDMNVIDVLDKTHLVPFGEYVPLHEVLGIAKIVPVAGQFVPGKIEGGLTLDGHSFGLLICYEGIFPEISTEYTKNGVEFFVNITNDAWYGISSAPYQHFAFYSFRAVETGRAVLRSANTGLTGWMDSSGRIRTKSELYKRTLVSATIPTLTHRTLYSYTGDRPYWLFVILCFYWIVKSTWGTTEGDKKRKRS